MSLLVDKEFGFAFAKTREFIKDGEIVNVGSLSWKGHAAGFVAQLVTVNKEITPAIDAELDFVTLTELGDYVLADLHGMFLNLYEISCPIFESSNYPIRI